MKKRVTKKLVLNKETISNIEMDNAKGGWPTVLYTNPICPLTIPGDGCPSRTENVYICTYTNA